MLLTIAIPTYNRQEPLCRVLERLAPQLDATCELLIVDNASVTPAQDAVAACGLATRARVIRHEHNIGAHANIHRAIELASGEWIWVLGDDDLPVCDAVTIIKEAIARHNDAFFINFLTSMHPPGHRGDGMAVRGLAEFTQCMDDQGAVNFMSASVWRRDVIVPYLRLAYHYAYSMSWVFALLIPVLSTGARAFFSSARTIEVQTLATESARWSHVNFVLGYATVLELAQPLEVRLALARKLLNTQSPEHVAAYLLAALHGGDRATARWTYRAAIGRLIPYADTGRRIRYHLYGILFWAPGLSWRLCRATIRAAARRGFTSVAISDLEGRSPAGNRL